MDTGYRGVSVGHRTQSGVCWTQDTVGWVLDRGHREVGVRHRIQRGGCWTQDTEG